MAFPVSSVTQGITGPTGAFIPHSQRGVRFTATISMGNLLTLGPRMEEAMHTALIEELGSVALQVVELAKSKLQPGHGYDTGRMHDGLTAILAENVAEAIVAYDLSAPNAEYWFWVEFGHMLRDGRWWPGYHFLGSSIVEMESQIRSAIRRACSKMLLVLAGEARV